MSRSQRVPITTVSLKDRIAALGLQDRTTAQSTPPSQSTTPLPPPASGFVSTSPGSSTSARVRDKAAQFEAIGGTPVPRGSFGLGAPPIFAKLKKTGELYGNRIPGGQPPPLGRQWPPGSHDSGYGFEAEGASPGLRSVSMPLRMDSHTGSDDDGTMPVERTTVEETMDRKVDTSTDPIARIEIVPPTPAFPPPGLSMQKWGDSSVPRPTTEKFTEPLPKGRPALLPETSRTPSQLASDPVLDSYLTCSPSIHSTASSPLPSVEEEPVTLDADRARTSPSSEQPTLTRTPEQLSQSTTPIAVSPRKKKTRPAPPPNAFPSSPLTSPRLRRSASARGRDRHASISSASGENGSVFTAPPVQGDDVGGGINLSPTLETLDWDSLGLDLRVDGEGSSSEEEGVRRGEVPQAAEVTGDVVEHLSIGESFEREMTGFVEELKRDDGSIIEDLVSKEQEDHPREYERSNSSGTTDYTAADTSDIGHTENLAAPPLVDDLKADFRTFDERVPILSIHDAPQVDAHDSLTEGGSPRPHADGEWNTPQKAVEAPNAPELNQPVPEQMEGPPQESAPSKVDAKDKQNATPPTSPDTSSSSFPLPSKGVISRAGLSEAGTASPARVLRELKQLGMEKRSSIVLGPTRRVSVLSAVLPPSPERLVSHIDNRVGFSLIFIIIIVQKFVSDSENSPKLAIESPLTSKFVETKPMDTPTSDKASEPAIALPSEYWLPVSVDVTSSRISSIDEIDKCANDSSQQLPPTPPTSGSITFPTPSTSAGTSTGLSSGRSTDDLPYVPSLEFRKMSTPSNRHSSLHGAPPMPPPSGPLPPIPLSPPPPTPPPKDVPVSFGNMPPPKSFRQLYTAGRLPPSSRGPGMHQSAQGRPLIGRATSLCDRPLPAIPIPNVSRRSSSAVHSGSPGELQLL